MIKNTKQHKATKELATKFEKKLKELEAQRDQLEELDFEFSYNSTLHQYQVLAEEISTYESLTSGTTKVIKSKSIDAIHEVLIQARLARKWSQTDLANELGIHAQQIQQYEANNYENVGLARVLDIIDALELEIELKDIALPKPNYLIPETIIRPILERQEEIRQRGILFA